jgi:hypothetical protein
VSIYDSSTLGTQTNQIIFNDDSISPYFRMRSRVPTRRELKEFETVLPDGSGISDTTSFIGKMYMILEGTMYPDDEVEYHEGREMLRKLASLEIAQEDADSDSGYVLYRWEENTPKEIALKVLYVDMQENTRLGLKQPFRLLCKIKYPVIYSTVSKSAQLITDTVAQLGGAQIPAYVPLSIPSTSGGSTAFPLTFPVVFGASTSLGSSGVTNDGDIETWPTIVINGPVNRPKVTNRTTGESIELEIALPSTSDSCIITYDQDSVAITSQNQNVYGKLTSDSRLFKIQPGNNDLTFTGTSMGEGAQATVNWRDAWPMS